MRNKVLLGGVIASFSILTAGLTCRAAGGPTIISWSGTASETGQPTSSQGGATSGGGTAQIGSGSSSIFSSVNADTTPMILMGVGDPNTYDFYLLGIQTQIPSGLSPNTASVSGTIDFGLSQPTLVYLDGYYSGDNVAGYSFSGAVPWSPPMGEQGVAPSNYTLLAAGDYQITVNDSNPPRVGTGSYGNNIADIAFLVPVPEPTALLIAVPVLFGNVLRRRR